MTYQISLRTAVVRTIREMNWLYFTTKKVKHHCNHPNGKSGHAVSQVLSKLVADGKIEIYNPGRNRRVYEVINL